MAVFDMQFAPYLSLAWQDWANTIDSNAPNAFEYSALSLPGIDVEGDILDQSPRESFEFDPNLVLTPEPESTFELGLGEGFASQQTVSLSHDQPDYHMQDSLVSEILDRVVSDPSNHRILSTAQGAVRESINSSDHAKGLVSEIFDRINEMQTFDEHSPCYGDEIEGVLAIAATVASEFPHLVDRRHRATLRLWMHRYLEFALPYLTNSSLPSNEEAQAFGVSLDEVRYLREMNSEFEGSLFYENYTEAQRRFFDGEWEDAKNKLFFIVDDLTDEGWVNSLELAIVYANIANCYFNLGKEQDAERYADLALKQIDFALTREFDPLVISPCLVLAEIYKIANDWEKAKECFEKAKRAAEPDDVSLYERTLVMCGLRDFLVDRCKFNPNESSPADIREAEKLSKAICRAYQAIPGIPDAILSYHWRRLGEIQIGRGQYSDAITSFETALDLVADDNDFDWTQRAETRWGLATSYFMQGNLNLIAGRDFLHEFESAKDYFKGYLRFFEEVEKPSEEQIEYAILAQLHLSNIYFCLDKNDQALERAIQALGLLTKFYFKERKVSDSILDEINYYFPKSQPRYGALGREAPLDEKKENLLMLAVTTVIKRMGINGGKTLVKGYAGQILDFYARSRLNGTAIHLNAQKILVDKL